MKKTVLAAFAGCLVIFAAGTVAAGDEGTRTYHNPEGLSSPSVFSHVVTTTGGTLVHVSGQTARGPDGNLVGAGDLGAQFAHVMERLEIALAAVGATMDDVIRRRIYVVDLKAADLPVIRATLAEYFPGENQATSTLVGVTALAQEGYLVEMDVTAHLP